MANVGVLNRRTTFEGGGRSLNRVSWGAILLGVATTLAVGLLLMMLGAAIGLDVVQGGMATGTAIGSAVYVFLAIVASTFLGAMVASKMSRVRTRSEGAATGLGVWAVSMLAGLFLLASAIGALAGGALGLTGQALQGAGTAAQGRVLTPEQQAELRQQLPAGEQIQQQVGQIAGGVAGAGSAAGWGLFLTGLCAALAGLAGGVAGLRKGRGMEASRRSERTRRHGARPATVSEEAYHPQMPEPRSTSQTPTRETTVFRRDESNLPPPDQRH